MTTVKQGKALIIKDARILIAGAASLVGSHTADLLLKEGAREVLLLDNFSFGSMDAIAHLQNDPRIKIVRADLMRLPDSSRGLYDARVFANTLASCRCQYPGGAEYAGGVSRQQS